MAHTCHAIGCTVEVAREMFMCQRHWYALPKPLRNWIWQTYRPGQWDDLNPSRAYCDAAKTCILHTALKEGRAITGKEPELLLYDLFSPKAEGAK